MITTPETCAPVSIHKLFEATLGQAVDHLHQTVSARLNALPITIVNYVVGHAHYVRCSEAAQRLRREGTCCRCGSSRSQHSRLSLRHIREWLSYLYIKSLSR